VLGTTENGWQELETSLNPMQTDDAPTHLTGNGSAAKAKQPRRQRAINPKFPCAMNFGITVQMAQAVLRQCPRSSPFSQSDIGRLALHAWLLTNDESYRREIVADGAMNEVQRRA
jgi:hypothetical protein